MIGECVCRMTTLFKKPQAVREVYHLLSQTRSAKSLQCWVSFKLGLGDDGGIRKQDLSFGLTKNTM